MILTKCYNPPKMFYVSVFRSLHPPGWPTEGFASAFTPMRDRPNDKALAVSALAI
jgi:hypothetical protein